MPFYEYQCRACGAEVEVLQKISDAPLKKCPECGKSQLVKLISAPVFRLKGGGWYETDFKTDQDKKRNLVESEPAETKAESKAESKVEAKSESKESGKSEAGAEAKPAPKPEMAKKKAKAKARPKAKTKRGSRR